MKGWVSLHKQIRNHWVWEKPDYLKAWLDMLMMANYKDQKQTYKGNIVLIKRGEFPISYRKLAVRWGWSAGKIKRFILLLKADTMVDTHTDYGFTVVKVRKYNEFQLQTDTATDTVIDTPVDTPTDTTIISNNKYNKTTHEIHQPNLDLSEPDEEKSGDGSFAIKFFKLWFGDEGKIINPPTPYERKDIVQYGLKYNSDIKFWEPFLLERKKRISLGQFHHMSIKAFCGGAFRDYTATSNSSGKSAYRKTKSGLWIAYCLKCAKKSYPNDFQLKGDSCCGTDWVPDEPVKDKKLDRSKAIFNQLQTGV